MLMAKSVARTTKGFLFLSFVLLLLTTWNEPRGHSAGGVKIISKEQTVFDWTFDRCAMTNIPDGKVRAFRDDNDRVQLIVSHNVARRMIGNTLNSVEMECQPIMTSDKDPDPSHFNFEEWLHSVYTPDGKTVYGLVHNEFLGHEAATWNARGNDFHNYSTFDGRSTQGHENWYYQEWNGFRYQDMVYNSQENRWEGEDGCQLGPNWSHPGPDCAATRKWVSPVADTVTITGTLQDLNSGGGDGVRATILKGRETLWSDQIANGETEGRDFNLEVSVQEGDALYFRVHPRGTPNYDSTSLNLRIALDPGQCPSGQRARCHINDITFAKSIDGGETYTQPPAPDHLVASAPYRYDPDTGPWGYFAPSNIIHHPEDEYYYALIRPEERLLQDWGTCVMRTKTLDDPKGWRAWGGTGFNVRFIDPYTEREADPANHICQVVSRGNILKMHNSLTYNTYFDRFLLMGISSRQVDGRQVRGYYYSLSDDLIHWTPRKLIMEATFTSDRASCTDPALAYGSLLDPTLDSRNFEVTGQRPYLYFTRFNPCRPHNHGLDRDLVRVQLEFNK